jgi:asparagine synthase (glutamine-hydrolysing)
MSAIYGFIGEGDLSLLSAMGERLSHRGSSIREWSPAPGVFFGQRNFFDENGVYDHQDLISVAATASLFNRSEVADQLNLRGALSIEADDRQLIRIIYKQFGPSCFSLINGDFVVAIWDQRNKHLVLARDPLGSRVLYYYTNPPFFAFASEYKALLVFDEIVPTVDLEGLQYLQATKFLPPGRTLLKEFHSIQAGNWIEVSESGVSEKRYWDINIAPKKVAREVAEEELRNLFLKSLEKRVEDVPVLGAELSGGIDSAAVVSAIRRLRPNDPIKTYTIGSGEEDPEIIVAREVAASLETEHHVVIADPRDLPEDLPGLVWHMEDPVGRTEGYLYYKLMRLASKSLSVIFGGAASDGLFAGMPRHKIVRMIQLFPLAQGPLEEFYHYSQISYPPNSTLGRAIKRAYYGKGELPAPLIQGASGLKPPKPLSEQKDGLLNRVLRDGLLYGTPIAMAKSEKTHIAYGVEFRSPFTDLDLIRYAFQLPEHFKLNRFKEKYILRRALLPLVPKEVVNRPKFPQGMDYNLRLSEVLDSLAERYLNPRLVKDRSFFNPAEIESLRQRPANKPHGANQAMRLWTAILTEIWAQTFLDCRGIYVG